MARGGGLGVLVAGILVERGKANGLVSHFDRILTITEENRRTCADEGDIERDRCSLQCY